MLIYIKKNHYISVQFNYSQYIKKNHYIFSIPNPHIKITKSLQTIAKHFKNKNKTKQNPKTKKKIKIK